MESTQSQLSPAQDLWSILSYNSLKHPAPSPSHYLSDTMLISMPGVRCPGSRGAQSPGPWPHSSESSTLSPPPRPSVRWPTQDPRILESQWPGPVSLRSPGVHCAGIKAGPHLSLSVGQLLLFSKYSPITTKACLISSLKARNCNILSQKFIYALSSFRKIT